MSADRDEQVVYVLTVDAVKWAIETLQSRLIHPFFPAYLHLRERAIATGSLSGIQPSWKPAIGTFMRVEGNPERPYYRPMSDVKVKDPRNYWLNQNLAGSWSPSSLRPAARRVVETVGTRFTLRPNHAQLARTNLLFDEPLSVVAYAAWWYRDFGFIPSLDEELSILDLAGILAHDFRFEPPNGDYDTLFVTEPLSLPVTAYEPERSPEIS